MKIDTENDRPSARFRWGVPLAVATGVAVVSVAAVSAFGRTGDAEPLVADPAGNPTRAATPTPASPSAGKSQGRAAGATSFTVTSTRTTSIDAGTVSRILASCLGQDASRFHPVLAVRTPVAAQDQDGVVIAVDPDGQYVQCGTKGDKGTSTSHPPTFINDRLWGTGHKVSYFESTGARAGQGQYLMVGAGHYTSDIAKITISYNDSPKEYPAVMAGGAFVYAASASGVSPDPKDPGPVPYVHAYDASGKEIYNQKKDPQFSD
ncbi:hypothetical protein ACIBUY_09625 [Streptomyces sp. NPDC050085]|uniref:hypothetical protein n=1 Tax=Streptomyces sp. NPDC050085 TaxID=3365600 RepID=UPI0037A81E98